MILEIGGMRKMPLRRSSILWWIVAIEMPVLWTSGERWGVLENDEMAGIPAGMHIVVRDYRWCRVAQPPANG